MSRVHTRRWPDSLWVGTRGSLGDHLGLCHLYCWRELSHIFSMPESSRTKWFLFACWQELARDTGFGGEMLALASFHPSGGLLRELSRQSVSGKKLWQFSFLVSFFFFFFWLHPRQPTEVPGPGTEPAAQQRPAPQQQPPRSLTRRTPRELLGVFLVFFHFQLALPEILIPKYVF